MDPQSVVNALNQSLASLSAKPVGLHEPCFQGREWEYVKECLDTGWVSTVGKFVDRFEGLLEDITGVEHAIAVVNGTAALHVSLILAGVEREDEVMLPALSFVAPANAIVYCGAVPHFIDSEEKTLGVDPVRLEAYLNEIAEVRDGHCFNKETGRLIRAVVAVHTFGHPVDLDVLREVCDRFHLILIEDAAESLGSFYKGKHTGHWGQSASVSFNGNKIVTTGGGGAVLVRDAELAKRARHITTTARRPHGWNFYHDQVGYNYRLPNINAALGCAQLEQLPEFLKWKRSLAMAYQESFANVSAVRFFEEPEFAKSNYWLNVLLLAEADADQLNALIEATRDDGILTRPAWTLLCRLPMFQNCPRMNLDQAENLELRIVNIPSSAGLKSPQNLQ